MKKRIAINGLGRIGRAALKILMDKSDVELIAINDLVPADNLAYLLKFDSVYGKYHKSVEAKEDALIIEGKEIKVLNEKEPADLPWQDMKIDTVFECTGIFTKKEGLQKHLRAGAKNVILSAPAKSEEIPTVVHGVNSDDGDIKSCASCITNCITPVVEIMERRIGVEKAIMSTIHAYTSSQGIVDGPAKKVRRGRSGAVNIVPTSTGAAKATTKVLPEFTGKFDGAALRVPVPVGSVADMVFLTKENLTSEELNRIFREEADSDKYRGIVDVSDEHLVSTDIIQNPAATIVDLTMTQVVDGNMVKIMSWYDNEWGYASQMIKEALK